jgi:hypothetical protein
MVFSVREWGSGEQFSRVIWLASSGALPRRRLIATFALALALLAALAAATAPMASATEMGHLSGAVTSAATGKLIIIKSVEIMGYCATVVLDPYESQGFPQAPKHSHERNKAMPEIPTSSTPGRAARRWRRASADITKSYVAGLATTASLASAANGDASITPAPVSTLASQRHGNARARRSIPSRIGIKSTR